MNIVRNVPMKTTTHVQNVLPPYEQENWFWFWFWLVPMNIAQAFRRNATSAEAKIKGKEKEKWKQMRTHMSNVSVKCAHPRF